MLASPAPGGTVSYAGVWQFNGAIGTFLPATNYTPPRVISAEAAVVVQTDAVREKSLLVSLLSRLLIEVHLLVDRRVMRSFSPAAAALGSQDGQSGFVSWRPVADVRSEKETVRWTASNRAAAQGPTGMICQGVPLSNVGIETSSNVMWLGNAADSDATIVASRQRGPLLGLHGAALILNFDALADDAALTAAAQKVVTAVSTFATYP